MAVPGGDEPFKTRACQLACASPSRKTGQKRSEPTVRVDSRAKVNCAECEVYAVENNLAVHCGVTGPRASRGAGRDDHRLFRHEDEYRIKKIVARGSELDRVERERRPLKPDPPRAWAEFRAEIRGDGAGRLEQRVAPRIDVEGDIE